ncbi:MAG: ABC transporter permease [Bacteroidota bacterium]
MSKSWLIAIRELRERVGTRSFLLMSILGPAITILLTYILFAFGSEGKQEWNILIVDPSGIMENKILANEDKAAHYSFADNYMELEDFRDGKQFQKFDAMVEINEKVLGNKTVFVFHRKNPSVRMQTRVQFQVERRLEERMVDQFTKLSLADFRKIKQPMNVAFRDVYDPLNESADKRGWVGFFFGTMILLFIFLFGMTILRSISAEKSNRIVEVLMASVSPVQLMFGKILGIGLAAFLQLFIWFTIIALGLYGMREFIFIDQLDAVNVVGQIAGQTNAETLNQLFANQEYNDLVDLIYQRVNFGTMISFFLVFFVFSYLFYGAFFAAIGASSGSESDGQQFVLPVILILIASIYLGYFMLQNPDSPWVDYLQFIPFTAPMAVMVKLAYGYDAGSGYQLYLSLLTLFISALITLGIAGRIYKNGMLQFGHRVGLKHLFRWMKKN